MIRVRGTKQMCHNFHVEIVFYINRPPNLGGCLPNGNMVTDSCLR